MAHTGVTIHEGKDAPTLAQRTTLRLGGRVLGEVCLSEPSAAGFLPEIATRLGGKLVCLGAGSNILAGEGPLSLVVVRNTMPPAISLVEEDQAGCVVRATASVRLPKLIRYAAAAGLSGLEGLSGIPGTVGGAVAMNAGSYGQCIGDTLVALEIVTGLGDQKRFFRDALAFEYRAMTHPEAHSWWMVTAAEFRLTRKSPEMVHARGRECINQKRATQPVTAASAGCVFKNPSPDNPAGKLLDAAGFKGKRLGGMAFSSMHANFLVNEGGGTSSEALALLDEAMRRVVVTSGIMLEPEVKLWV